MEFFGFRRPLDHLGFFETPKQKDLEQEIEKVLLQGRLIAIAGIVGSGKTTTLVRFQNQLKHKNEVIVSYSRAVEKERVNLNTLMLALFYDLFTEKDGKLSTQPERRERQLLSLIQKCRKPVVLFVDDAHGLHPQTLITLKRLIELVRIDGGTLSVVLVGHPKLKNDLRRPTLEEIGARATVFSLEGIRGYQREYIDWVLRQATDDEIDLKELVSQEAIEFLAEKLTTPLQIEQYLSLAFESAYEVGQKPLNQKIIAQVLAHGLNDLEPYLVRHGYNDKMLSELLNVKRAEIRALFYGQLPPTRSQELREQLLKLGIPLIAS